LENFLPYSSFHGLQVGQSDPICLNMIRFEHGTTTVDFGRTCQLSKSPSGR
jgi:hypothetical protein